MTAQLVHQLSPADTEQHVKFLSTSSPIWSMSFFCVCVVGFKLGGSVILYKQSSSTKFGGWRKSNRENRWDGMFLQPALSSVKCPEHGTTVRLSPNVTTAHPTLSSLRTHLIWAHPLPHCNKRGRDRTKPFIGYNYNSFNTITATITH